MRGGSRHGRDAGRSMDGRAPGLSVNMEESEIAYGTKPQVIYKSMHRRDIIVEQGTAKCFIEIQLYSFLMSSNGAARTMCPKCCILTMSLML